jgi:hypothetical protein
MGATLKRELSQTKAPPAMNQPAQVEQLGPIVDLRPEALLEPLLGLAQPLRVLEVIQVREDAHDLGEAVDLKQSGE